MEMNTSTTMGPMFLAAPNFDFSSEQWFVIALVVIGCTTGVLITLAGISASVVNSIHRRRIEESLKQDMLDRGMSAEEIVKVIESAAPPEDATGRWIACWCKKK
jgi:hypothetical protein